MCGYNPLSSYQFFGDTSHKLSQGSENLSNKLTMTLLYNVITKPKIRNIKILKGFNFNFVTYLVDKLTYSNLQTFKNIITQSVK